MQDFTRSLKDLVDSDMIDRATAFEVAPNPEALKMALKGIEFHESGMLVMRRFLLISAVIVFVVVLVRRRTAGRVGRMAGLAHQRRKAGAGRASI